MCMQNICYSTVHITALPCSDYGLCFPQKGKQVITWNNTIKTLHNVFFHSSLLHRLTLKTETTRTMGYIVQSLGLSLVYMSQAGPNGLVCGI